MMHTVAHRFRRGGWPSKAFVSPVLHGRTRSREPSPPCCETRVRWRSRPSVPMPSTRRSRPSPSPGRTYRRTGRPRHGPFVRQAGAPRRGADGGEVRRGVVQGTARVTAAPAGAGPESPTASARSTALAVVVRALGGAYLSRALDEALGSAELSGQDRSLAADLAYGTLRRYLSLGAVLGGYLEDPDRLPPRVRAALCLGAYELLHRGTPPYAAVSAWVDVVKAGSPRHAGLVNAVLRRLAREAGDEGREGASDADPDPVRDLSLPPWLFERF